MKTKSEKHKRICVSLRTFSRLFNKSQWPEDKTLIVYADLLENFEEEKITMAFSEMILVEKITFFPSCPEIIAGINPEISPKAKAQIMSDNIFAAMSRFGRGRYAEIEATLTCQEFQALELVGKNVVGESAGSSVAAVKYQIRNTCVALLESSHVTHKQKIMKRVSQVNQGDVLEFKHFVKNLLPTEDE